MEQTKAQREQLKKAFLDMAERVANNESLAGNTPFSRFAKPFKTDFGREVARELFQIIDFHGRIFESSDMSAVEVHQFMLDRLLQVFEMAVDAELRERERTKYGAADPVNAFMATLDRLKERAEARAKGEKGDEPAAAEPVEKERVAPFDLLLCPHCCEPMLVEKEYKSGRKLCKCPSCKISKTVEMTHTDTKKEA